MMKIDECRFCRSSDLRNVLDLGVQDFTGVFPHSPAQEIGCGPLRLMLCSSCGLVQLGESFPLDELYGTNYGYRSGLNRSMVEHLSGIAQRLSGLAGLKPGDTVCDIGANDGTLLRAFNIPGLRKIAVDPTIAKFQEFYDPGDGIQQVQDFFSAQAFKSMSSEKAKVITSIAMFYDLEDPLGFALDVKESLQRDGLWHFEQSYMPWMLRSGAYDTICHEHLEYYSLNSIHQILQQAGLRIVNVSTNIVNGGSVAVTATHTDNVELDLRQPPFLDWLLAKEVAQGVHSSETWNEFAMRVKQHRDEFRSLLVTLRSNGKKVMGLGASTKGNVLLQFAAIGPDLIEKIGEVNPDKFGKWTPGTGIPITSEQDVLSDKPDYIVVFPWHFRETFVRNLRDFLVGGGRVILPLPDIEIVG